MDIVCEDEDALGALVRNFGAMSLRGDGAAGSLGRRARSGATARLDGAPGADQERAEGDVDFTYRVEAPAEGGFRLSCPGKVPDLRVGSRGELIYALEADLVVRLQLARPDLLFLHAAALEWEGAAVLLVGRSGAGKSTTCWGLLHHGFRYLSDEMAPISLEGRSVLAYPHALCMKREPPAPYRLPASAWRTSRGVHLPIHGAMARCRAAGLPLRLVLLVEYDPSTPAPRAWQLGAAEAVARIYPSVLNALAHDNSGLAAVAEVMSALPVLRLASGELGATCRLVRTLVEERIGPQADG